MEIPLAGCAHSCRVCCDGPVLIELWLAYVNKSSEVSFLRSLHGKLFIIRCLPYLPDLDERSL